MVLTCSSHAAIAIKESAHVGDKNSKRLAKGVDDLGELERGGSGARAMRLWEGKM